jgi:hypothetical protein
MMKIPLKINLVPEHYRISVNINVMPRSVHARPILIEFVVDTGSPCTLISFNDAKRLNIPISRLSKVNPNVSLGSRKFERYVLPDVDLCLKDEKGGIIKIKSNSLTVLKPTTRLTQGSMTPSILGWDFLLSNNFRLVLDAPNEESYLEKVD